MGVAEETWYSVTVETRTGDDWTLVDSPCTLVAYCGAEEFSERVAKDYYLDETPTPWRVRVFAGYNRYEDLLVEVTEVRSRPLPSH